MLARRSHDSLARYRLGEPVPADCPLKKALTVATIPRSELLDFLRNSKPTPAAKALLKRTFQEFVLEYDAKTGDQLYMERTVAEGPYYASPVAANGHIYFTSLADGVVTVLKAGGNTPEVVATNPILGERVSATPAIADDAIYIRTAGHLYAFAERK